MRYLLGTVVGVTDAQTPTLRDHLLQQSEFHAFNAAKKLTAYCLDPFF